MARRIILAGDIKAPMARYAVEFAQEIDANQHELYAGRFVFGRGITIVDAKSPTGKTRTEFTARVYAKSIRIYTQEFHPK